MHTLPNSKPLLSTILQRTRSYLLLMAGVGMAGIGLKGFLLPNHFLDGGAMGVSLLLNKLTQVELSYLIVLVNLPFILLGAKQISWEFAIKSVIAIVALSFLVHYLHFEPITSDKLLISIFGGFFLGAGIGLSIRGGAVIDGTEVLAISVSRKSSLTVGDFITLFNAGLFGLAVFLTGIETAMYSMLTYLAASKTVDFLIHGIEEYIGVIIVSQEAETIRKQITEELGRGVTVFRSDAGFGKTGTTEGDNKVLFCVVTRLEVTALLNKIELIDPNAFVVQHSVKDTRGGMIKKRPLH
ncbi:MAG: YitT family protein [Chitinophagaceae bacterium]